jgi:hypothetical protein
MKMDRKAPNRIILGKTIKSQMDTLTYRKDMEADQDEKREL